MLTAKPTSFKSERGMLRLPYKKILLGVLVFSLIAWVGKSLALHYVLTQLRGFKEVTLVDTFIWPLNHSALMGRIGDGQIKEGLEYAEKGDVRACFLLLRSGLKKQPADVRGRMIFAQLNGIDKPEKALAIYQEGFKYVTAEDEDYIKSYLGFLMHKREDQLVIDFAEEWLAKEELSSHLRTLLVVYYVRSLAYLARYDEAIQLLKDYGLYDKLDGYVTRAEMYLQVDAYDSAIRLLEEAMVRAGGTPIDSVYQLLEHAYGELGDYQKAKASALNNLMQAPMESSPRLRLINYTYLSGDEDRAVYEAHKLLLDFPDDVKVYESVVQFAGRNGLPALAARCFELAMEKDFVRPAFSISVAEAKMNAGQYDEAIRYLDELTDEDPVWISYALDRIEMLKTLIYLKQSEKEMADVHFNNLLQQYRISSSVWYGYAEILRKQGYMDKAAILYEKAWEADSTRYDALAELILFKLESGDTHHLMEDVSDMLELRMPDYDSLVDIQRQLQGDFFLFEPNRGEAINRMEEILYQMRMLASN